MTEYKTIELANGSVAKVDVEDFERVLERHWHIDDKGYARTNIWSDGKKSSAPRMHRLITGEADASLHVDHINGDKLDNRKSNLRVVTCSENLMNRGKQSNNSSGYKGVIFDKSRNKWRAEIAFNKERKYLGRFDSAEEASQAYREATVKYHGEHANLG